MSRVLANEDPDDRTPFLADDETTEQQDSLVSEEINVHRERGQTFGNKSLNTFYSLVFIINQIYGPGVLSIPIVFQQAGWLPTTLVLAAFTFISSFSATLLAESLSLIPGNKNYDRHIEYTVAIKYFYGKKWYVMFQVFLNITLQSYNIASIVVCAQSLDQFLIYIFKHTYALQLYPSPHFFATPTADILYNNTTPLIAISLGYLIIAALCIPSGFLNLDDNVKVVQLGSFIALVVLLGEFIVQFAIMGVEKGFTPVPAIGASPAQLVSVFIFSWAYPMFIPSWVNEKKNEVSVNKVIWFSSILSFAGYLSIGLLAAFVFGNIQTDNILGSLSDPTMFKPVTVIASYLFSLGVIAPGIPVCCITTRYNLFIGHICSKRWSYFWGVIAPWLVGFIFSQSKLFAAMLAWSSLIFGSIINFVVPMMVYNKATKIKRQMLANPYSDSVHYSHLSTVNPWPARMRNYAIYIVYSLIFLTVGLVGFQIVYDLYLEIAKGESVLGN
eukprot:TRINITY_DN7000_c0_g1_i1.p1 TRINITY_DN7000_c0_g1~~TRINITY_DN7000_c0_g1_i1.p1  ORF type:complete len:499 (-),score=171.10 TRINITY_DN7000_c0_g1_i1:74-1570(-)